MLLSPVKLCKKESTLSTLNPLPHSTLPRYPKFPSSIPDTESLPIHILSSIPRLQTVLSGPKIWTKTVKDRYVKTRSTNGRDSVYQNSRQFISLIFCQGLGIPTTLLSQVYYLNRETVHVSLMSNLTSNNNNRITKYSTLHRHRDIGFV